jgi:hypothetical protein
LTRLRSSLSIVLALSVWGVVRADQVVQFQNGRTLRVLETRRDGDWTFLKLGRKSEFAIPTRLIASVKEASGTTPESIPNIVISSASGGGSDPRGGGRPGGSPIPPPPEPQQEDSASFDQQDSAGDNGLAQQAQRRAAARRGGREAPAPQASSWGNLLNRTDPAGTVQQVDPSKPTPSPGIDVGGGAAGSSWPSKLDHNRQGRKGQTKSGDASQGDEPH